MLLAVFRPSAGAMMMPVPDVPMNCDVMLKSWKPVMLFVTTFPEATTGTLLASAPSLNPSRYRPSVAVRQGVVGDRQVLAAVGQLQARCCCSRGCCS